MYMEQVSEALRASPPAIRGVYQGGVLRLLRSVAGEGQQRIFTFEHDVTYGFGALMRIYRSVALMEGDERVDTRLKIVFGRKYAQCPGCGVSVKAGGPFWTHYNGKHARRPFWLNREDWPKMLEGPYTDPP